MPSVPGGAPSRERTPVVSAGSAHRSGSPPGGTRKCPGDPLPEIQVSCTSTTSVTDAAPRGGPAGSAASRAGCESCSPARSPAMRSRPDTPALWRSPRCRPGRPAVES
ncbi:hypothetical protein ACFFX0_03750 [Citricoccus parietis]|uniref:Uncharacterized protein n=1 Tax=Citricoccus parietis TaxID=592307 RepID=A0ABV5FUN5_9MICC